MPAVQMWASWAIIHICTSNGKHLLILNCLNNALATKQLRQDDEFDFWKAEHRGQPLFDPIECAQINSLPPPPPFWCRSETGYLKVCSIGLVIHSKQIELWLLQNSHLMYTQLVLLCLWWTTVTIYWIWDTNLHTFLIWTWRSWTLWPAVSPHNVTPESHINVMRR